MPNTHLVFPTAGCQPALRSNSGRPLCPPWLTHVNTPDSFFNKLSPQERTILSNGRKISAGISNHLGKRRTSLVARKVKDLPTMQETQVQSLSQKDPLEKGMATQPNIILAWRIPWTEEPGRLQSMGLQRIRHDWLSNTFTTGLYLEENILKESSVVLHPQILTDRHHMQTRIHPGQEPVTKVFERDLKIGIPFLLGTQILHMKNWEDQGSEWTISKALLLKDFIICKYTYQKQKHKLWCQGQWLFRGRSNGASTLRGTPWNFSCN